MRRPIGRILAYAAYSIFIFVSCWLSVVSIQKGGIPFIWLATPTLIAILLRTPQRRWWPWCVALFVGGLPAGLIWTTNWATGTVVVLANLLEALVSAWPIARAYGVGIDLTRSRDLRHFAIAAAITGPVVAGSLASAWISNATGASFFALCLTWVGSHSLSILIVTPLICTLDVRQMRRAPPRLFGEAAAWTVVLAAFLAVAFGQRDYPLLFLPFVILVHMAVRIGPLGLLLGVAPTAIVAHVATVLGCGPIAAVDLSHEKAVIILELFLAGTVLSVLPVVAWLSDRTRLERQLRATEARFRAVFENSPEMLLIHELGPDADLRISACNQMASEILTRPPADTVGRTLAEVLHADCVEQIRGDVLRVLATGQTSRRQATYMRDGRSFLHEKIYVPLREDGDGRPTRVLASVRDVTQVAEFDRALRESERRLRVLTDSSSDMLVELDRDLRRTYVSRASIDLFGRQPEELLRISPLEEVHPDDRQRLEHCIRQLLDGVELATSTHRLPRSDGSWVWIEANWRCRRDEHGECLGFVASVRNVEERQKQEALLVEARREAERASAAKSDFLATMSHEIRTPLNGIAGYTGLLLEDDGLNPTQRLFADRIRISGAALRTVVDDILDFSKIEAGQIELDPVVFRPAVLVEDVVSIVRGSAIDRKLRVEAVVASTMPEALMGDENRIRQVLLNLMINAVKFTTAGEAVLTVLDLGTEPEGRRVAFDVRDTGIGIPADQMERLFQRFSQVDGSINRRYGGTGLGLAISQQLVGLMGGEILVESEQDVGSRFSFEIVLPEASREARATLTSRPVQQAGRSRRILVVEDVEVNRDLARVVLSSSGHRVDTASDGIEAVNMVREGEYDIVFMDLQMPGMDGLAATRKIRSLAGTPSSVPIVAMTAAVLPGQIAAMKAAGMNDHLGKPFEAEELDRTIEKWTGAVPSGRQQAPGHRDTTFVRLRTVIGRDNSMRLLDAFERDLRLRLSDVKIDDPDRIALEAHAIFGEAAQLGFADLAAACRDLEHACEAGRPLELLLQLVAIEREKAFDAINALRAA